MPIMRKNLKSRKTRPLKTDSSLKEKRRPAAAQRRSPQGRAGKTGHHGALTGEPYVYECTRLGCGYRIWRDEKAEAGEHRFDLKCPKCHNREFRCLGKGDVPETFEVGVPTPTLDFDDINPIDLGTN